MKIALIAKAGSGKNLFHSIARKHYPDMNFQEEKMAGELYCLQGLIQFHLDIDRKKDGKLLQFLGQHYKEQYGNSFWVDRLMDTKFEENTIITDCRFIEEVEACIQTGFKIVKINRRVELREDSLGNRDANHISETAMDSIPDSKFDFIINNNGSMELFEGAVCSVINQLAW